jgi:hypothetical protein
LVGRFLLIEIRRFRSLGNESVETRELGEAEKSLEFVWVSSAPGLRIGR